MGKGRSKKRSRNRSGSWESRLATSKTSVNPSANVAAAVMSLRATKPEYSDKYRLPEVTATREGNGGGRGVQGGG